MKRAVGIVRVSRVAGREGESFASPVQQRERIVSACEREGLELVKTHDELDVSGGTPLAERRGLLQAVEAVERGEADVVVAAYFDRLVRSLRVQDELVSRVERAGGRVMAVDVGEVTSKTASQWLSSTLLGAVAEHQRRTSAERSAEAQARAVARGVCPWPNVPPGYRRGADGVLERDDVLAPIVAAAFEARADGATVAEVRELLAHGGVERTYHGVQALLRSRVVLGEIRFGELVNTTAHPAIVDEVTWNRVQRARVPRGRRPKSDRLLARLGVLRCATCDARMVVGVQTQNGRRYPFYRCPPTGDCPTRVTVGAVMVEELVERAVREAIASMRGTASVGDEARTAEARAIAAQEDLDAALRAFAGLEGEKAARDRLLELRAIRDDAVAHADRLRRQASAVTVDPSTDWNRTTLAERRALVTTFVDRVSVGPGRGLERVTLELLGE